MRNLKLALGLSLLSACGAATAESPEGSRYEVTEVGVVRSAIDDTAQPTPSPDWLEVRVKPIHQRTFVKAGTDPDLTRTVFGRADRTFPREATPVEVDIGGLAWREGDSLQLVSPNVGLSIHGLEAHLSVADGAKAITGQLDWKQTDSPLIDGTRDTTTLMQMSNRPTNSGTYYNVVTRAGATRFTTGANPLQVSLAEVTPDRTLDFRWRGSAYAKLASDTGPQPQARGAVPALSIRTLPAEVAKNNTFFRQSYNYLPSLVDFGPLRGDDYRQTIRYGNPLGSSWLEVATMSYAVPVFVPDAGTMVAMLLQAMPVDQLARQPFAPVISPVRDVRINSKPLVETTSGVGTSPTLTWEAPALGTASNYSVTVQGIVPDAVEGRKLVPIGTFVTDTTSLTLPEFAMTDAPAFVFTITAIAADRDLGKAPLVGGSSFASADHITAVVRP